MRQRQNGELLFLKLCWWNRRLELSEAKWRSTIEDSVLIWPIPGLFLYLRLLNSLQKIIVYKIWPMTRFELRTSGNGSNWSLHCATTNIETFATINFLPFNIIFFEVVFKFCETVNKPSDNWPSLLKCFQCKQILPNLIALVSSIVIF